MNRPTEPTDLSRLIAWLRDPNRKPPELAFTAGELREAADLVWPHIQIERIPQRATPASVRVSESMKGDHEQ